MQNQNKIEKQFNKEDFANLLIQAQGSRSLRAYARESDVSVSQLSRYINKVLDNPPSVYLIKKMSVSSQGVSTAMLLEAAGYDVEKYISEEDVQWGNVFTKEEYHLAVIKHLLVKVKSGRYRFSINSEDISPEILEVKLASVESGAASQWFFINCISFDSKENIFSSEEITSVIKFISSYAKNAVLRKNSHITVITTSSKVFNDYKRLLEESDIKLNFMWSAVLVNKNNGKILDEAFSAGMNAEDVDSFRLSSTWEEGEKKCYL